MHHPCDKCDAKATCHQVEIFDGVKTISHLCDRHAAEAGLGAAYLSAWAPPGLLEALQSASTAAHPPAKSPGMETSCPGCGQTLRDFHMQHLLGCSECYRIFEGALSVVVERAQKGASHHVGKVPAAPAHLAQQERADRMAVLLRMRGRLDQAVRVEDYRLAASLRDQISRFEQGLRVSLLHKEPAP